MFWINVPVGGVTGLGRWLLAGCLASSTGCRPAECEDEFCEDHLALVLEKSSPWLAGMYDVDMVVGSGEVHCDVLIPYDPDNGRPSCDDGSWSIGGSDGTILDRMAHRGAPTSIEFTLSFEGGVLISTTLQPEYEDTSRWNRKCGPPCDEAVVEIAIP